MIGTPAGAALSLLLLTASPAWAETFVVAPDTGQSGLVATFDAPLGERIVATSPSVSCTIDYDEKKNVGRGGCSLPLTSVRVDDNSVKSEHFHQWATNKKSDAKQCRLEAVFENVRLQEPVEAQKPARFVAEAAFRVCGRARADGGKEKVEGTVVVFPPGAYGKAKMLKIRAHVSGFDRDRYQIGPRHTDGWLAKVQALASVVAQQGSIDLSLFAEAKTP